MGSFQAHISYNFSRTLWAAFDATYYVGGRTTISGVGKDDRQANAPIGDAELPNRKATSDQGGREPRGHHPDRRQLHDVVGRLADGVALQAETRAQT